MLGPACHGPNFPPTFKAAGPTLGDLSLNARTNNRNFQGRAGPFEDDEMDEES